MPHTDNFSRAISGTTTWGSWGKKLSKAEMIDLMYHCVENGLTTFDRAVIFGRYSTKTDFGKATKINLELQDWFALLGQVRSMMCLKMKV
ncbi:MAG: hypothetical protein R2819_04985 [Allomuricauda sp.]